MIVARRIFAQQLTARRVNAVKVGDSANDNVALFDFNAQLLALPAALTALNATFTRASTATVNQGGTLVSLASGQFGTSYDSATGLYGYLAEPAATNRALYSQDPSNAAWEKTNFTVTSPITAPDGTSSMYLSTTTDSASAFSSQDIAGSAVAYVYSAFVKAGNARYIVLSSVTLAGQQYIVFDTATAAVVANTPGATPADPIAYANGVYRIAFSFTGEATITALLPLPISDLGSGTSTAGDTCYSWGMQLETGSRATSYIPTAAATATRAASVLSVPLANIPGFTAAQYTLSVNVRQETPSERCAISIAASISNYAQLVTSSGGDWRFDIRSGGVGQAYVSYDLYSTARQEIAVSVIANSLLGSQNGATKTSDLACDMPIAPTALRIGQDYGGSKIFNGRIRRAGIITRALTQAQINGMTA